MLRLRLSCTRLRIKFKMIDSGLRGFAMPAEKFGKTSPRVPLIFSSARFSDRFTKIEETAHSEYAVAVGSETITKIVRADSFNAPEHSHSEAQLSFFRKGSSGTFLTHSVVGRSHSMSVAPGFCRIHSAQPATSHTLARRRRTPAHVFLSRLHGQSDGEWLFCGVAASSCPIDRSPPSTRSGNAS